MEHAAWGCFLIGCLMDGFNRRDAFLLFDLCGGKEKAKEKACRIPIAKGKKLLYNRERE